MLFWGAVLFFLILLGWNRSLLWAVSIQLGETCLAVMRILHCKGSKAVGIERAGVWGRGCGIFTLLPPPPPKALWVLLSKVLGYRTG